MVKEGLFTVQLVEAKSKAPYKEFTKDGSTFVEVEPDAEYWIRVEKEQGTDEEIAAYGMHLAIDGVNLGFRVDWFRDKRPPRYLGLWERKSGSHTYKALRFYEPSYKPDPLTEFSVESYVERMGRIDVMIHKADLENVTARSGGDRDVICPFASMELREMTVSLDVDNITREKHVMSHIGTDCALISCNPNTSPKYGHAELLKSISLRYCSTVGLIRAGLLVKSDTFDATHTPKKNEDHQPPAPTKARTPKKMKITETPEAGVECSREVLYYDISDD
jgi:hypothetical protein